MFDKIKSLQDIVESGLNVHRFFIPDTYCDFWRLLHDLKSCTIRTDHAEKTEDLPFFVFKEGSDEEISRMWDIANTGDYKLIISDGIKYDPIQKYNLVAKIEKNGDFVFEASEVKVPLRQMYRYPLLSCDGNIASNIWEWHISCQKYGLDKIAIKKDLEDLYSMGFCGKWLEITKYPVDVGIKQKPMVFWQIH